MGSFSLAQKISSSLASFWLSSEFRAFEASGALFKFAALKFKDFAPQEFEPPLELCSLLEFGSPLQSISLLKLAEFSPPKALLSRAAENARLPQNCAASGFDYRRYDM